MSLLGAHFTADAKQLFMRKGRNPQKGTPRLLALGISGTWAMTWTSPNWGAHLQSRVKQALLQQRGLSQQQNGLLRQGPWFPAFATGQNSAATVARAQQQENRGGRASEGPASNAGCGW